MAEIGQLKRKNQIRPQANRKRDLRRKSLFCLRIPNRTSSYEASDSFLSEDAGKEQVAVKPQMKAQIMIPAKVTFAGVR